MFYYKQKSNKQKNIIILCMPKSVNIYIYIFLQYITMVKPTEYKQRETVKNNSTKDYRNMSEERLYL